MSKELHTMSSAELREHWGNKSSNFLVGKTIRRVRYLTESEREDLGWYRSPLVIEFEDGHWLVPMSDDEGNDGGSLWTSSATDLSIIPTV